MRILNTLEDVREVFASQLETTTKCTDDYLNGRTKEELVSLLVEKVAGLSPEAALKIVELNIQEHRTHAGQAKLFVLIETPHSSSTTTTEKPLDMHVISVWEDELSQFIGASFAYMVGKPETPIPKLITPKMLTPI